MKRLAILGSTGSIGEQVLDVVEQFTDRLRVVALTARTDHENLCRQMQRASQLAGGASVYAALSAPPEGADRQTPYGDIRSGPEALLEAATLPDVDLVIIAVVGMAGLPPALAALEAGKNVALATKEALVAGGHLMTAAAARTGAALLPIDSEHSAIFQCLQGSQPQEIAKIILTCSGGPFSDTPQEALNEVSVEQALNHPNWDMGPKITIDSATLMNKGLEIIEAQWLFDVTASQIQVIVHRQSIIHSMVEFRDTSVMAQLGLPDMRLPIQYALFYPDRLANHLPRLNLLETAKLTFEAPDTDRFPALNLAYHAAETGGSLPAVMNAANEEAVRLFLQGGRRFPEITDRVAKAMDRHEVIQNPSFEQLVEVDAWARRAAGE